jgi:hypothetical protein
MRLYTEATKISKQEDKCSTKKAILRLRAGLDRLWSLEKLLPRTCIELDEDGLPHLTERALRTVQNDASQSPGSLEDRLESLAKVRIEQQTGQNAYPIWIACKVLVCTPKPWCEQS